MPIPTFGWQLQRMIAHLDNEILRLILKQSYPTHCNFFIGRVALWATVATIMARGCSLIMVKGAGVVDRRTPARLALKGTCNAVHDLTVRLSRLIRFMFWPRVSKLEECSVAQSWGNNCLVFRDFSPSRPHFAASSAFALLIRMAACSQVVSAPLSTVGASP